MLCVCLPDNIMLNNFAQKIVSADEPVVFVLGQRELFSSEFSSHGNTEPQGGNIWNAKAIVSLVCSLFLRAWMQAGIRKETLHVR